MKGGTGSELSRREERATRTLATLLPVILKDQLIAGKYKIIDEVGAGGSGPISPWSSWKGRRCGTGSSGVRSSQRRRWTSPSRSRPAWAPGEKILYKQAKNNNLWLIDPMTEEERMTERISSFPPSGHNPIFG